MNARDLTLNIAVNLGRVGRWATEGNKQRIEQFLADTQEYVDQLAVTPRSKRFDPTYQRFLRSYHALTADIRCDEEWAEEAFTWANILTHRAGLA